MGYKRLAVLVVVVVLVVVLAGYQYFKVNKKTYQLISPTRENIVESLQVTGFIDAVEKTFIPYGTGKVSWVGVKKDQEVRKWQALVRMDTRTLEKQLLQYMNTFNKQFRTNDNLFDSYDYYGGSGLSLNDKRVLENANFDLNSAVLGVEIADIYVKNALITSPIEGVVTRLDKPYGGVFAAATDVIEIINPKTVYFSAVVDELDIAKVVIGQKATLLLDAYIDNIIDTKITQIGLTPSISRSGGTGYEVKLEINQEKLGLSYRLGMNGTVKIELISKSNVLVLPIEAVRNEGGKEVVEVWLNNKKIAREISLGVESDDKVEILTGLDGSEKVVLPDK